MSLFPIESRLIGGKLEATPGTPEALVSADYDVRAYELSLSSLEVEMDDSTKYATGDHTRGIAIAGIAKGGAEIGLKLARGEFEYTTGSYSGYKLPFDKYFRSAGLNMEVVEPTDEGTEDGVFSFYPGTTADLQPLTLGVLDVDSATGNGIEYSLYGAMATLVIDFETGKPYNAKFAFSGGVDGVVDVLAASVPEFIDANALSVVPDVLLDTIIRVTELNDDGSIKSGGQVKEFCIETGQLDTGLTLAIVKCQASPSGVLYYTVTSRDPKFKITPRLEAIADFDFWSALNDEKTWKLELIGNDVSINVPRAQLITATLGDTEGFVSNELTFSPLRNIQGADSIEKQKTYSINFSADNVAL